MGFIKTVLIILFIYQGFKVLSRFLTLFLLSYAAKKVQEKFKDQMGQQMGGFGFENHEQSKKKVGEVHIKSSPKSKDSINSESVGDYVDFEEVD